MGNEPARVLHLPRSVDEYFDPHGMVYMGHSVAVPGEGP